MQALLHCWVTCLYAFKPVPSEFVLLLDSFASSLYAQATADMSVGSIVGGSAGHGMSSSAKTPLTFLTSLTSQKDV